MLVSPAVIRCVAFAAYKKASQHHIAGTVFFMLHPVEGRDLYRMYVVTARHVIELASERSTDGSIHLRVNEQDGRCSWISTKFGDWEFHDDSRVDVAVMPMNWTEDDATTRFDHGAVVTDRILTDDAMRSLMVGIGETLYFPGLFVKHSGATKNIPILRTGTIAAMADEPVNTRLGAVPCFLAEVRSLGGHSGSPVFVHWDGDKREELAERIERGELKEFATANEGYAHDPFLGLVHGHFPIRPDQFTAIVDSDDESAADAIGNAEDFNSGIAVITPGIRVLEVLLQPRLVNDRLATSASQPDGNDAAVMD